MDYSSKPKICFILGITQRSGTNFLFRLLREHPSCIGPGPIWEDNLLRHSNILNTYTRNLYKSWNPRWDVENRIGDQELLLRFFGDAIERFLRLQTTEGLVNQIPAKQSSTNHDKPKILLTKTPNVVGLDNFFVLFPDAYLILLVRDGRAVVESGVRSFEWDYENAMRRWRNGAQTILDFKEKYENENKKFMIVKYEDIVINEKASLLKIFEFLDLAPELYDFEGAKSLGITGSSEIRNETETIHWKKIEKKSDFNPLARFGNWDRKKHERFNWIAGEEMAKLGYELELIQTNKQLYFIENQLSDFIIHLKTSGLRIVRKALNILR